MIEWQAPQDDLGRLRPTSVERLLHAGHRLHELRYGLITLSTSNTTVGVVLLDVAAFEPGVAPGSSTAVSTDPEICTPGCGP